MRATAQFPGKLSHRDHPHRIGILLPEKHHRSLSPRFGERQRTIRDRCRIGYPCRHVRVDQLQLLGRYRLRIGKIKSQPICIDLGTLLLCMGSQVMLQGMMQQMGSRMRPSNAVAPMCINAGNYANSGGHFTLCEMAVVDQYIPLFLCVFDNKSKTLAENFSLVPNLPTTLTVERSAIQNHTDR